MASKTPKILKQSKELLQENPQQFLQKTNNFLEKYPKAKINSPKNKPKSISQFPYFFFLFFWK